MINLNHNAIFIGSLPYGTTDMLVKVGRKTLKMSIVRNSALATVCVWNNTDKSRYSKEADMHYIAVKNDTRIDRRVVERIADLQAAVSLIVNTCRGIQII